MPRKLKVFRTPIGFHDAYVAAPSQKAALAAWGSDANLFARGTAEEVTDPALTAEPLAHPGTVIRVSRGDLRAQLEALGPRKKPSAKSGKAAALAEQPAAPKRKPKPPPKRDKLDKAEAALVQARAEHEQQRAELDKQREALERKLDALKTRQAKETARLEERLAKAEGDYRQALARWSG